MLLQCLELCYNQIFLNIREEQLPSSLLHFKEQSCIAKIRRENYLRFKILIYRKKIFLRKLALEMQNLFVFKSLMPSSFSNLQKTLNLIVDNYYEIQFKNPLFTIEIKLNHRFDLLSLKDLTKKYFLKNYWIKYPMNI